MRRVNVSRFIQKHGKPSTLIDGFTKFVLLHGAQCDWNARHNGQTALAAAAAAGSVQLIRLLLARGGCVHQYNAHGVPPIQCAVVNGHLSVVRYLLNNGVRATVSLLHQAVAFGRPDIVLCLAARLGPCSIRDELLSAIIVRPGKPMTFHRRICEILLAAADPHTWNPIVVAEYITFLQLDTAAIDRYRYRLLLESGLVDFCCALQPLRLATEELRALVDAALPYARNVPLHTKMAVICTIRHFN